MTDLPLQFPVMVFRRLPSHGGRPAREALAWCHDPDYFTTAGPKEISWKALRGALLVDMTGMGWRVLDMFDAGPRWSSAVNALIGLWRGDNRRVGYELQAEGQIPFESLRERICAAITGSPFVWCDRELVYGKGPRSPEVKAVLDEKTAKVRQATTMPELIDTLDAICQSGSRHRVRGSPHGDNPTDGANHAGG